MRTIRRVAIARSIAMRGVHLEVIRVVRRLLDVVDDYEARLLDRLVNTTWTIDDLARLLGDVRVIEAIIQPPAPIGIIESLVLVRLNEDEARAKRYATAMTVYDRVEAGRRCFQCMLERVYYEPLF